MLEAVVGTRQSMLVDNVTTYRNGMTRGPVNKATAAGGVVLLVMSSRNYVACHRLQRLTENSTLCMALLNPRAFSVICWVTKLIDVWLLVTICLYI